MDKFTLPPSPNWQLSNILACNDDGLLAYGSRCEVAILDLKSGGKFNVSLINLAHKDKLNVIVFSPTNGSFKNCLATCGDDNLVRVWDFQESRLLFSHSGHKDGVRVTGLDWSKVETNRIVSVNDLGTIVCWDLASNTIRRLHCGVKMLPLCLACCPHEKDLIAIGCKNGVTLVVDTKGSGKIVHRLRGHEQDVISVSWCPVPYNVIRHKRTLDLNAGGDPGTEEKVDKFKSRDLLLATGGIEKSIFIWRTGSDGRYEVVLTLPNLSVGNSNGRKKGTNNAMLWTSLLWADPYTLLSTSQFGELLAWDLNRVTNYRKAQPRLLHSKHHKGCFSIACPVLTETVDRGDDRVVWSTAMDKHIIGCKLSTGSIVVDIPTLGGAVFSMALSPLDPNRLAIGSSDSRVFVWNLSDIGALQISSFWRKIIGKVMALSWHPREENWLAYATSDGHVGLIDVGSNKLPTLFRLHHRKQVYRLCWAPPLLPPSAENGDKLALYSVGDGDVFQYNADVSEPNEEPLSLGAAVLNAIDQSQNLKKNLIRSDIVFKPDNSCFVIGNDNGSIYILSCKTVSLQHVLYPHKKLMNNLEWHPETVASDNNISPYKNWLASTCDNVKIHNIPPEGQPELVATLSGHSEKIVGLAWSPHFNGRLLSASYDYSVQIWDVLTQSCLGVFLGHSMAAMCALFSPLDPDIIISGSSDNTVRLWHISQLPPSTAKPEKKKGHVEKRFKKLKEEAQEATELTVGMSDISLNSESVPKPNSSEDSSIPSSSQISPPTSNKGTEDYQKRMKNRAAFGVTWRKLTNAKYFDVLYQRLASPTPTPAVQPEEVKEETPSVDELGYLDFFGDDKAMLRLLMVEESHLTHTKQPQLVQQSMLWRGDVSEVVSQAITKKQLSDWIVSLAPMAGFDKWEAACEAYSAQLVECGDVVKASSYLLAINKVHEAIRLLTEYKHYREAIAIAKCRLPQDDELTSQVYTEWGNATRYQGSFHLAAHCFLAAGNIQACIEVLARIKELKSLKIAASIASQHGLPELACSLATECLTMAMVAGNLAVGHKLIAELPQYQFWSVFLNAAEVISKVKNRSEEEALSWLAGWREAPISLWDHLNTTCSAVRPIYSKLLPHLPTNKTPEFERDMWYTVSGQLAAAWGAQVEATSVLSLRHLVLALSTAYNFQCSHPSSTALMLTMSVIAPHGLFGKGSILIRDHETVEEKQLMKSLKAFVCAAVVHWLSNNWSKVSTKKLKTSEDKKPEEEAKEGEVFNIDWLIELLTRYSAEALDEENISFFIKKAQKEDLQNFVTKENIKKSAERKAGGISKEKQNETEIEVKNIIQVLEKPSSEIAEINQVEKVEESFILENKEHCETVEHNKEQVENSEEKSEMAIEKTNYSKTDQVSSNGNHHTQDEKNGNLPVNKISSTEEKLNKALPNDKSNGDLENGDKVMHSPEGSKTNGDELSSKLNEIKKLEEALSKFESVRISVPSPFTAYTNIKYVIEHVVSKKDPSKARQLQENCDNLWKKSQQ